MLIAMRRGAAGWVAKILFFLLILSFAVWGIGDYLTPETNPVVAEVGEIEIRRSALDSAERSQLEQLRQMLGRNFDASALPEGTLRDAALQQLIGQAALDMEALDLGIDVSDSAVAASIQANPSFQTGDRFDAGLFRRTLFAAGMTEDAYVAGLKTELSRSQLGDAVAARVPPPLPLVEAMFVLERQERSALHVTAPTAGVEAPEPTEAELKAYVESNAEDFAEPERRDVRALIVSRNEVARSIQISEAELSNRYEDSKDQFVQPETRTLVQALFQDETEARAFVTAADGVSAGFQPAAEAAGGAVTELGALTRDQVFPKAVADAAFAAAEGADGAVVGPIRTALGWHVVLVETVTPQTTVPFETLKEALRTQMQQEAAETAQVTAAHAAEDALAAGGDLAAAAKAANLPITQLTGIDRRGADRTGAVNIALPKDQAFLAGVFERAAGDQSGLIELKDGVFVTLVVDAIHPTAPKPLDAVRGQAADAWKAEKRVEIVQDQIATLQSTTSAEAFESAATAAGFTVNRIGPLGREAMATGGAMPATLVEQVFAAQARTVVTAPLQGAVHAVFVADVIKPVFDPASAAGKDYLDSMTNAYASDRVETLSAVALETHPADVKTIVDAPPAANRPLLQ
mgnify:CR=1 FL=1